MNLLDLRKKIWAPEVLAHAAPGLAGKLGDVCASHTIVGKIALYFQQRYGFSQVHYFRYLTCLDVDLATDVFGRRICGRQSK